MRKAEILYTNKGYSYIKCKRQDCLDWGGLAICDSCGKYMEDDVYLIFILGQAFCPECFKEWIGRSKRYNDDIELQKQNHERWYRNYGFEI